MLSGPTTQFASLILLSILGTPTALAQTPLVCPSPFLPGAPTTYVRAGGDAQNTSNCGGFECAVPMLQGNPIFNLEADCNPNVESCALKVEIQLLFPGNTLNDTGLHSRVYWFTDGHPPPNQTSGCWQPPPPIGNNCAPAAACGEEGQELVEEQGRYFLQVGDVYCPDLTNGSPPTNPLLQNYLVAAISCNFPSDRGCVRRLNIPLDLTGEMVAREIGCPEPPKKECPRRRDESNCQDCLISGGGGGPPSGGGGGWGSGPDGGTGPGAELSHMAGGAGGPGWPGTTAWLTHVGRYWSHDYAERIVEDPDDSHVWLITRWATFREFSNLSGGTYLTNSPTDEYRTLRKVGAGWTLTDLDGTVQTFGSSGEWLSTADRFGNTKTATYGGGGELDRVDFPDGRAETFSYYPVSEKLERITEIGVGGSPTRDWTYTWNGDDLERIDLPDGRAWEFFYEDTNWPGYLTRVEVVGTSGGREVDSAFEYECGKKPLFNKGDVLQDAML